MKKLQLLTCLLPGIFFSQLASGIAIYDTRNTDNPPSDYRHQIQGEFKNRSIIGAPGIGTYSGLLTIAPWGDNTGDKHHQLNFNNGGIFYRTGFPAGQWESWNQLVIANSSGNVSVSNKLEAKEIKVTTSPTADFVFEKTYQLPNLEDVEKHILEKKHLPEIASAAEMQKEGVNIGEFQIKLLQKIEELTLYSIEQNKLIRSQQKRLKKLEELHFKTSINKN
ncbi:hypothetical protein OZ662_16305 [Elizabethkingia sp. HX WYD]|nr:hypothetical protein [Elizabethkingia meningoseptica]MDX8576981.1 hypothetical protein [Elizabethkingia sp. HX WYD]